MHTYGDYGVTMTELDGATARQIAKAATGSRLSSYTQAENASLFMVAAANDTGAYYKSAYWFAVVARLTGSRALLLRANGAYARAGAYAIVPLLGSGTSNIAPIMKEAASTIRSYAGSNAQALAVASILDGFSEKGVIAARIKEASSEAPSAAPSLPDAWNPGKWISDHKWYLAGGAALSLLLFSTAGFFAGRSAIRAGKDFGEKQTRKYEEGARKVAEVVEKHPEILLGPEGALVTQVMKTAANPRRNRKRSRR